MKALAASVAPWIKRLYSQNSINKLIALFCKLAICNPAIPVRAGDFTKKGAGERNYSSEVLLHQREKTTGNIYAPCVCKKNVSGRIDSSSVGHTSALSLKLKVASTRFFTRLIFT